MQAPRSNPLRKASIFQGSVLTRSHLQENDNIKTWESKETKKNVFQIGDFFVAVGTVEEEKELPRTMNIPWPLRTILLILISAVSVLLILVISIGIICRIQCQGIPQSPSIERESEKEDERTRLQSSGKHSKGFKMFDMWSFFVTWVSSQKALKNFPCQYQVKSNTTLPLLQTTSCPPPLWTWPLNPSTTVPAPLAGACSSLATTFRFGSSRSWAPPHSRTPSRQTRSPPRSHSRQRPLIISVVDATPMRWAQNGDQNGDQNGQMASKTKWQTKIE